MAHCALAMRSGELHAPFQESGEADDMLPECTAELLCVCYATLLYPHRPPSYSWPHNAENA